MKWFLKACLAERRTASKATAPKDATLTSLWVPGAFEIPLIAKKMAKDYDAVICLGAVIRGGTPHFEYVASEVAKGIAKVSLDSGRAGDFRGA